MMLHFRIFVPLQDSNTPLVTCHFPDEIFLLINCSLNATNTDNMIFLFDIQQLSLINDCFCICRSINGPPRGYGKQGNLPFLSMGIWEHEQICQGNMETM